MAGWNDLPSEVKLIIYGYLCDHDSDLLRLHGKDFLHNSHLSAYATVSLEWQDFFEGRTFKKLTIKQSDLHEFGKVLVPRRRPFLRRLWLQVELRSFYQDLDLTEEIPKELDENANIFSDSIGKLFTILKEWETREKTQPRKLSLTLLFDAYSPDDSRSSYQRYNAMDYPPGNKPPTPIYQCSHRSPSKCSCFRSDIWFNTVHKPWLLNRQPREFDLSQISADSSLRLPKLDFVTGFIIPRQFYANIPILSLIAQSFPNLQRIGFEQWRRAAKDNIDDYTLLRQVMKALPFRLQCFSAFLDTSVMLSVRNRFSRSDIPSTHMLRKASYQFYKIDVSFFMDARYFFATFMYGFSGNEYWPNLERFSMTSSLLSPDSNEGYTSLLLGVAKAASRMPKLRMLQIWWGYDAELCVFRYTRDHEDPLIEWVRTNTAPEGPGEEVLEAWQEVANKTWYTPVRIKQTVIAGFEAKYFQSVHPVINGDFRSWYTYKQSSLSMQLFNDSSPMSWKPIRPNLQRLKFRQNVYERRPESYMERLIFIVVAIFGASIGLVSDVVRFGLGSSYMIRKAKSVWMKNYRDLNPVVPVGRRHADEQGEEIKNW
ncbi:uncharacterized protein GGS22DRAFT_184434 [Annulohypoxylon maeteangense]|uniref:uncharacterized protein n=1 Tax=Annulohypoxylon maeteangense TaxID=1927788 RepID=UPI002007B716|nr:uncharacterized protein GGS22DRAFT_184434 [Annulohypoxylon maeteangense]KAI0888859.1 hypothetical protein GGS22DRAFT_184434 [Annulohypoxylon maeteangense]